MLWEKLIMRQKKELSNLDLVVEKVMGLMMMKMLL